MKADWSSDKLKCLLQYSSLEHKLQSMARGFSANICAVCSRVCCDIDICREAYDSAFLRAVRDVRGRSPHFDDDTGWWRQASGCILESGRPPVCYGYFCDSLINHLDLSDSGKRFIALSRAINRVGERCLRGRHIILADSYSELEKANWTLLESQLKLLKQHILSDQEKVHYENSCHGRADT